MLDVTRLGLTIQAAFVAGGAVPGNPLLVAMSTALATAIISELTTYAEVLPTGTPPMAAGVNAVTGKGIVT